MNADTTTATKFVFDKVGYEPTKAQEPIVYSDKRFILVAGGEQAGKSIKKSRSW